MLENNKLENKNHKYVDEAYDVVVVGAGHAGCEAGLAYPDSNTHIP